MPKGSNMHRFFYQALCRISVKKRNLSHFEPSLELLLWYSLRAAYIYTPSVCVCVYVCAVALADVSQNSAEQGVKAGALLDVVLSYFQQRQNAEGTVCQSHAHLFADVPAIFPLFGINSTQLHTLFKTSTGASPEKSECFH